MLDFAGGQGLHETGFAGMRGCIEILRQNTAQKGMETRTVIRLPKMAELVQNHVVGKMFRQAQQIEIQVNIALGRAASPVREIVLYEDSGVLESEASGQHFQSRRKICFSLLPEDIRQHFAQPFLPGGIGNISHGIHPGGRERNGPEGLSFIVHLIGNECFILQRGICPEEYPAGQCTYRETVPDRFLSPAFTDSLFSPRIL